MTDKEEEVYICGIKCLVKKEQFPDGEHSTYTFTVDGWKECTVVGLRAAKRVISGRLNPAVRRTLGLDK